MTVLRALPWALAVMTATALSAADPSAGSGAPSKRPWLDVKLPAASPPGTPTAMVTFALRDKPMQAADWAGFRITVGDAALTRVPTGQSRSYLVAASLTEPVRFDIGSTHVLAHVHPGEIVDVFQGHDGGWVAVIGSRMRENAPKEVTLCGATRKDRECPVGYEWTHVFQGDPACPTGDDAFKCVPASRVRARGPFAGRAEVTNASASGRFDDMSTLPLSTGPLSSPSEAGPWLFVDVGAEAMPRIRLGDAEALLVIGPGEAYVVSLDSRGRIASTQVPLK
jgi:hypothetical protein